MFECYFLNISSNFINSDILLYILFNHVLIKTRNFTYYINYNLLKTGNLNILINHNF